MTEHDRPSDMLDLMSSLPLEVREKVDSMIVPVPLPRPTRLSRRYVSNNPWRPPMDGSSPLMSLPTEVRRNILVAFLPAKDKLVIPSFNGNSQSTTCDLLVLNRKISHEITHVLYEERTFVINIHEGLYSGGVSFLNSGLQRLRYSRSFNNSHFKRFEGEKERFGFNRLKRIEVVIHPCRDMRSRTTRHDPMLTYFTIVTMLKLLRNDKNRSELNYLKIRFAEHTSVYLWEESGRPTDMQPVQYWWNPDIPAPRQTSIHGISNVELILRGFAGLDKVHNIIIEPPCRLREHPETVAFITKLSNALSHDIDRTALIDDDLEHKLEVAHDALDDFIFQNKFGISYMSDPDVYVDLAELEYLKDDDDDKKADDNDASRPRRVYKRLEQMNEDEQLEAAIHASLVQDKLKEGRAAAAAAESDARKAQRHTTAHKPPKPSEGRAKGKGAMPPGSIRDADDKNNTDISPPVPRHTLFGRGHKHHEAAYTNLLPGAFEQARKESRTRKLAPPDTDTSAAMPPRRAFAPAQPYSRLVENEVFILVLGERVAAAARKARALEVRRRFVSGAAGPWTEGTGEGGSGLGEVQTAAGDLGPDPSPFAQGWSVLAGGRRGVDGEEKK